MVKAKKNFRYFDLLKPGSGKAARDKYRSQVGKDWALKAKLTGSSVFAKQGTPLTFDFEGTTTIRDQRSLIVISANYTAFEADGETLENGVPWSSFHSSIVRLEEPEVPRWLEPDSVEKSSAPFVAVGSLGGLTPLQQAILGRLSWKDQSVVMEYKQLIAMNANDVTAHIRSVRTNTARVALRLFHDLFEAEKERYGERSFTRFEQDRLSKKEAVVPEADPPFIREKAQEMCDDTGDFLPNIDNKKWVDMTLVGPSRRFQERVIEDSESDSDLSDALEDEDDPFVEPGSGKPRGEREVERAPLSDELVALEDDRDSGPERSPLPEGVLAKYSCEDPLSDDASDFGFDMSEFEFLPAGRRIRRTPSDVDEAEYQGFAEQQRQEPEGGDGESGGLVLNNGGLPAEGGKGVNLTLEGEKQAAATRRKQSAKRKAASTATGAVPKQKKAKTTATKKATGGKRKTTTTKTTTGGKRKTPTATSSHTARETRASKRRRGNGEGMLVNVEETSVVNGSIENDPAVVAAELAAIQARMAEFKATHPGLED